MPWDAQIHGNSARQQRRESAVVFITDPGAIREVLLSQLPRRGVMCFATKSAPGRIRHPARAIAEPYLSTGTADRTAFIVIDIDKWTAEADAELGRIPDDALPPRIAWQDVGLPPPHFIVERPDDPFHAHVAYRITVPWRPETRSATLARRVRAGLTASLHGDPAYVNSRFKSPFAAEWQTWMPRGAPVSGYALDDLADCVSLPQLSALPARNEHGGRNTTLFDTLRHWAYAQIRHHARGDLQHWTSCCEETAAALNASLFECPLGPSEVRSTARSVARAVWQRHPAYAARFRARQAHRGVESGKARQAEAAARQQEVLRLRTEGLTWRDVGAQLHITAGAARQLHLRAVDHHPQDPDFSRLTGLS